MARGGEGKGEKGDGWVGGAGACEWGESTSEACANEVLSACTSEALGARDARVNGAVSDCDAHVSGAMRTHTCAPGSHSRGPAANRPRIGTGLWLTAWGPLLGFCSVWGLD